MIVPRKRSKLKKIAKHAIPWITLIAAFISIWYFSHKENETGMGVLIAFIEILFGIFLYFTVEFEDRFKAELAKVNSESALITELSQLNDRGRTLNSFLSIVDSLSHFRDDRVIFNMQISKLANIAKSYALDKADQKFTIKFVYTPTEVFQSLQELLLLLPKKSVYRTVSCLEFWSDLTIGQPHSFLRLNKRVATQKGIDFERVILLQREFAVLKRDQKRILHRHLTVTNELENITTKVYVLDDADLINRVGNYAICDIPNGDKLIFVFIYRQPYGNKREFSEVRYYSVKQDDLKDETPIAGDYSRFDAAFDEYFHSNEAKSLADYIGN